MNEREPKNEQVLTQVINLARDKQWDQIDQLLPEYANSEIFIKWARVNLTNDNSNIRDLSASIFELAQVKFGKGDFVGLYNMMMEKR